MLSTPILCCSSFIGGGFACVFHSLVVVRSFQRWFISSCQRWFISSCFSFVSLLAHYRFPFFVRYYCKLSLFVLSTPILCCFSFIGGGFACVFHSLDVVRSFQRWFISSCRSFVRFTPRPLLVSVFRPLSASIRSTAFKFGSAFVVSEFLKNLWLILELCLSLSCFFILLHGIAANAACRFHSFRSPRSEISSVC